MKVILLKDVFEIGKQRQVVDVKTGYANNYLIKNKLAVVANDENMEKLETELALIAEQEAQLKAQAEQIKDKIDGKKVSLFTKSGPEGRLYGAVTSKDVALAIGNYLGVELDKRKVECDNIKNLGVYPVKVKLHPAVEAEVLVDVKIQ